IAFGGILFATLLCGLVGKLFHLLLPMLGFKNPLMIWALSPLFGFILVSIIFSIIAFKVHKKVDVYYRYQAGDLRLALWERLNARLGICVGILNGAIYFVLISFLVFNLTYLTTQAASPLKEQPLTIRLVNSMGYGLTNGFSRASCAVATLNTNYYQYADLVGFLVRNPQTAPRFVEYPALTSLWERDDMQGLVSDTSLTNALATGSSVGEILDLPSVQEFLKNDKLTEHVKTVVGTNMDDLMTYLQTGKSATYDNDKILGQWEFNVGVTIAWLRQSQPKMSATEMRGVRALWTAAYAQTHILVTADKQVFVKNFPRFQTGTPPFTPENWNGDWSLDDTGTNNYTLHLTLGGQDKFLT
ncbi:MAG: hypothetical protein JF609_12270, partial [Verrucomicrobia bacterium]|nr:hypothetical protein [Verrucomicrobiota bacterium]